MYLIYNALLLSLFSHEVTFVAAVNNQIAAHPLQFYISINCSLYYLKNIIQKFDLKRNMLLQNFLAINKPIIKIKENVFQKYKSKHNLINIIFNIIEFKIKYYCLLKVQSS